MSHDTDPGRLGVPRPVRRRYAPTGTAGHRPQLHRGPRRSHRETRPTSPGPRRRKGCLVSRAATVATTEPSAIPSKSSRHVRCRRRIESKPRCDDRTGHPGARMQRSAQLLGHQPGFGHRHALAATIRGNQQGRRPEIDEPAPHRVGRASRIVQHRPDMVGNAAFSDR